MSEYNEQREAVLDKADGTIKELLERKSVRVYSEREITKEDKEKILLAAAEAPSAGCQQLYTIIDVTDQKLKDKLVDTCDHQPFIAQAKMVLVFCTDCRKWYQAFKEANASPRDPGVGDLLLGVTDTAIAAQNAVTAAWALGIGSCYIGDIMENCEEQRALLNLPEYVVPTVMVVFGYPNEQQLEREKPNRIPMETLVYENTYPTLSGDDYRQMFKERSESLGYDEWMRRFCERKYNSDFSKEMTRSIEKYLEMFR